jgi:hypothetical protein
MDSVMIQRVMLGLLSLALLVPMIPGYPGVACPLRSLTGIPCPFCGTTTAVREASQLDLLTSLKTNPAPLLAVGLALGLLAFRTKKLRVPLAILLALPAFLWIVQLARFSIIDL